MRLKFPRVLAQHRVFQLQHVDFTGEYLAVDQPCQVGIAKFANRVRLGRPERFLPSFHADYVLG